MWSGQWAVGSEKKPAPTRDGEGFDAGFIFAPLGFCCLLPQLLDKQPQSG